MNHRVGITGLGIVSPIGNTVDVFWQNLVAGKSGIARITRFDPSGLQTRFAGEVKDFDPALYLDRKEIRRMDRYTWFAVAAAAQAAEEAHLFAKGAVRDEIGAVISSGFGGAETLTEGFALFDRGGPGAIRPLLFPKMISNMASAQVGMTFGVRGPSFGIASACASSTHAIGEAAEIIKRGDARAMFAGGSEAGIVAIGIAAFNALRALSTRNDQPERASRPFDLDRDGFVLAEGAAILILEDAEFAQARGARILAEVAGYGASTDASHLTAPGEGSEGAALAIRRALNKAGVRLEDVDYINAHGTGTRLNDSAETLAVKLVFSKHAYRVPISSTKSMTGHLMAAAGALEATACVLAIRDGIIPPTINYEHPDPECDLDYVPNVARHTPVRVAMSNSMGFGGQNGVLVLRKWDG